MRDCRERENWEDENGEGEGEGEVWFERRGVERFQQSPDLLRLSAAL